MTTTITEIAYTRDGSARIVHRSSHPVRPYQVQYRDKDSPWGWRVWTTGLSSLEEAEIQMLQSTIWGLLRTKD